MIKEINEDTLRAAEEYISLYEEYRKEVNRLKEEYVMLQNASDEVEEKLQQRIDKATKINQYIIDYGFDYDGLDSVDSLKGLIDMLVDYARQTKDILKGED